MNSTEAVSAHALVTVNSVVASCSVHARIGRALVDVDVTRDTLESGCACAFESVDEVGAARSVQAWLRCALVDVD